MAVHITNHVLNQFYDKSAIKQTDYKKLFESCEDEIGLIIKRVSYLQLIKIILIAFWEVLAEKILDGYIIRTPLRDNIWIGIIMIPFTEVRIHKPSIKDVIINDNGLPVCNLLPRQSVKKYCGYKIPVMQFNDIGKAIIKNNIKNGKSYANENDLSL